jgi:hypothetical protein
MRRKRSSLMALAVALAAVTGCGDERERKKAIEEGERRLVLEYQSTVSALVGRHNADESWGERIRRDRNFRRDPLLTYELQTVWTSERPVLFVGTIVDLQLIGNDEATVTLEGGDAPWKMLLLSHELRLRALTSRATVEALVSTNERGFAQRGGIVPVYAAIALIDGIESTFVTDSSGKRSEIKIATGRLLDIAYAPLSYRSIGDLELDYLKSKMTDEDFSIKW